MRKLLIFLTVTFLNLFLPFLTARSEDAIILHKTDPPVHQWIVYQAKFLWSNSEINYFLPSDWSDDVNSLKSKPITYGAWLEDEDTSSDACYPDGSCFPCGVFVYKPYCNHYWNHDLGEDAGLFYITQWKSAYRRARILWDQKVIPNYLSGNLSESYTWLGRMAHLLADMSVPAHVHLDVHLGTDSYENYIGRENDYNFKQWDASDSTIFFSEFPNLLELFTHMAEDADDYDSDDANGEIDQGTRPKDFWGNFTDEQCRIIGNKLMPEAISHVASLYQLFWTTTHRLHMTLVNADNNLIKWGYWVSEGTFSDFGFGPIGGSSSEPPAMAVFNSRQYMAVKGGSTNNIYIRHQDNTGRWFPWDTIPGSTNKSPALAAFNNRLYMAVKGATTNNIFFRSMDASGSWDASWTPVPGGTSEAPTLATFNNRLYLFVKGEGTNKIFYRSMDISGKWDDWTILPGATNKPVGLSVFNGELYVFVKGAVSNSIYYRSIDTSGNWTDWETLSGQTTEAPSATTLGGRLYVAVKGAANTNVYIRSMDLSGIWDSTWEMVPANTNTTPVLSTFYFEPYWHN